VDDVRIDNFGVVGDRLLLAWLGVRSVSDDFLQRGLAVGGVPRFGRLTAEVKHDDGDAVAWLRTRVVGYVEYSLEGPGGRLAGEETCENAYHGEVTSDSRWLRAVTPPFNPFADRRTCCEFRFFDRMVEALSQKGMAWDAEVRSRVCGRVSMLINAPPCVSCIGVICQFRLLFGGVEVRVSGGRQIPVSICPAPSRASSVLEGDEQAEEDASCDSAVDCNPAPAVAWLLDGVYATETSVGAASALEAPLTRDPADWKLCKADHEFQSSWYVDSLRGA